MSDDSPISAISGDLEAYKFYIEFALNWTCDDCGEHIPASSDIREGEEDAPYGSWQERQAREAMTAGWYVQPLTPDGSLTTRPCLCPRCARKRGLHVPLTRSL